MKRAKIFLAAIAICLALTASPALVCADVFADNFDDNFISPAWWTAATTGTATLAETNQRIEMSIPDNLTSTALMTLNFAADGDFDARIDYEILNWPTINDVRIVLQEALGASSGIASVTRFNNRTNDNDYYVTNFNNGLYPIGWISTTDMSGSLRFTRTGQVFSGYYGTIGDEANWNLIYSFDDPDNVRLTPLQFGLGTYLGLPGGTQVAFDNFRMNAASLVPEPVSTLLFLAGGSTMAAASAVRRRKKKI